MWDLNRYRTSPWGTRCDSIVTVHSGDGDVATGEISDDCGRWHVFNGY